MRAKLNRTFAYAEEFCPLARSYVLFLPPSISAGSNFLANKNEIKRL